MKKKMTAFFGACLATALMICACGSSDSFIAERNDAPAGLADNSNYDEDYAEYADVATEEYYPEAAEGESTEIEDVTTGRDVSREMLVYHCTIRIDTLEFDTAVKNFKNMIDTYGGFVENEEFSDGNSYGSYYVDSNDKQYTYNALVRIPSNKYDEFVSNTEGIGDVRSKSSYVDNVSTEYGTAKSTLEIYQAEYDRYLAQLENTYDDEIALEIQRELTEIMVRIAELKTRMAAIETDVAYSYVNITINAVARYQAPATQSTFGDRLAETAQKSLDAFLAVMEGILFFIIMVWWYIAIIAIIVIIIVVLVKRSEKKKQKKMKNMPYPQVRPYQGAPMGGMPQMNAGPMPQAPARPNPDMENRPMEDANKEQK